MAIVVQVDLLKEALKRILPFVGKRGWLPPPARNVLLYQQDDVLELRATDLETFARTRLHVLREKNTDAPVRLGVPPKQLMDFLKSLPPNSTLTIGQIVPEKAPAQLQMASDFGTHIWPGIPAEAYPDFHEPKGTHRLSLPATILREIIRQTAFAAARDASRPVLASIYFHFLSDRTNFVATDAHVLSYLSHTQLILPDAPNVILPIQAIEAFYNASQVFSQEDDITLTLSSVEAGFVHPLLEVRCKVIEDHYPDYQSIITGLNTTSCTASLNRTAVKKALERLLIFAPKSAPHITFSFSPDSASGVSLSARNTIEHNGASETLPCEYTGDSIELHFHGPALLAIIAHLTCENIIMRITAPNKPVIIEPETQTQPTEHLCLIMPVKPT